MGTVLPFLLLYEYTYASYTRVWYALVTFAPVFALTLKYFILFYSQ